MYVASEDGDADGELGGEGLELRDEVVAFFFVGMGCIVIIEVIEKINATVEVVEETSALGEVSSG